MKYCKDCEDAFCPYRSNGVCVATTLPKTSEDLEKAAEEYANSIAQFDMQRIYSKDDFKAGARWMARQMNIGEYTPITIESSAVNEGSLGRNEVLNFKKENEK